MENPVESIISCIFQLDCSKSSCLISAFDTSRNCQIYRHSFNSQQMREGRLSISIFKCRTLAFVPTLQPKTDHKLIYKNKI